MSLKEMLKQAKKIFNSKARIKQPINKYYREEKPNNKNKKLNLFCIPI